MKVHDFIFELGCEDLPAGELASMSQHLKASVSAGLTAVGLSFTEAQAFSTPRRLAVYLKNLATHTEPKSLERRGPAKIAAFDQNEKATAALQGFLKSCGAKLDDLFEVQTEKGLWLAVKMNKPAITAYEILPAIFEQAIKSIPLKRAMRWANHDFSFLRPVHWILALHGNKVIPCKLFGHEASGFTYGHRFHHPEKITINYPEEYIDALRKAYVLVDPEERRVKIVSGCHSLTRAHKTVKFSKLEEVINLVEWPVPLLCAFDLQFMQVPDAVKIATMEANQRVFPVMDQERMTHHFIAVANIESKNPDEVRLGNEKVVEARLSDAKFFYLQDLKFPLEHYNSGLQKIIFQQGLGSLYDKVQRLESLSLEIAQSSNNTHFGDKALQAAHLCKADLCTLMVQEFPELQGYMGKEYYLKKAAEADAQMIAEAIEDHYKPKTRRGDLPRGEAGAILAIADKIDTLVGMFAVGKEPGSSSDPFALRRQALGIISILLARNWPIDFKAIVLKAYSLYQKQGVSFIKEARELYASLENFMQDRLENYYRDECPDISITIVQAVLERKALPQGLISHADASVARFDPVAIHKRVEALVKLLASNQGQSLKELAKRVSNIVTIEAIQPVADTKTLDPSEEKLWRCFQKVKHEHWLELPIDEQYSRLLEFAEPIADFFDNTLVNDPDPVRRQTRHNLLMHFHVLFDSFANFKKL